MLDQAQLLMMLQTGQEAQVRAMLEAHLKRRPADAVANKVMAMIHGAYLDDEKAASHLQRACFADPRDGEARFMLGNVLMALKRHKESLAAYKECLKLAPGDVAASDGAAKCLISLGRLEEARRLYEACIAAHPDTADTYGNYATALVHVAKAEEALAVAERGLALLPENASLLEFVAYTSNFPARVDDLYIKSIHERWGRAIAKERAHAPAVALHDDRDPDRALRVGFVSGDFAHHACALFMRPLLFNLDRAKVIPFCYSTANAGDGGDLDFRERCAFRDIADASLDDTARAVRDDRIDILIDCSGLTQGQRLRAFAPRCAPVQATWLGYPNTTGVPTIDWRLVDEFTDPPGAEAHCTERLMRIESCFLCFTTDSEAPEPVLTPATASADSTAPVVFGSFNRMTKVNGATLDAWAAVLRAVPDSRMLVKLRIMSDELLAQTRELFSSRGVEGDRITALPFTKNTQEHALAYSRMDIALDAFPYNGTTTTCEAAWMGVPVVTLAGTNHRGRVGVTLNTALGQPELIARDVDDYVRIAAGLAADRAALGRRRLGLRARMAASPLCDATGYASRFERALRAMWHDRCRADAPR